MPRLPHPGGDKGNWGTVLNDYLSVVHNTDGTIKNGAIAESQLDAAVQAKLNATGGASGATGAQGPQGSQGPAGPMGATGPVGAGVPAAGVAGQLLAKSSDGDYATEWVDAPSVTSSNAEAVLFGDSWTQTSSYALRNALASALGMNVTSYGIGGAKFIESSNPASFWQEITAAQDDGTVNKASVTQVIFVGGMNNWAWASGAYANEAASIFAQLRTMYPNAKLWYFGNFPYRWKNGNCYRAGWDYFRAYQQAAMNAGFVCPSWPRTWSHGYLVANASDWRYPGNSLWTSGGVGDWLNTYVHPTADGFALFAKQIAQYILGGNSQTQHTERLIVSGTAISGFFQIGSGLQYSYLTGKIKQSGTGFHIAALLDFQLAAGPTLPDYWLRLNQAFAQRLFFESGSGFPEYLTVGVMVVATGVTVTAPAKLALDIVTEDSITNYYLSLKTEPAFNATLSATPTQYRMIINFSTSSE